MLEKLFKKTFAQKNQIKKNKMIKIFQEHQLKFEIQCKIKKT